MPTYEYVCEKCGHRFEEFQKMSDEPLKNCPECEGEVRRLIGTGAGIIFKGSGFYQTDYKQNNASRTRCGREQTCCGREVACDAPPSKD
jgi:putative FmdB family regulatory protein